jgi:2'-5' RNA ligase
VNGEKIRAFLALDLDAQAQARVRELMGRLQGQVAGVRWVRAQGMHLTLRFLGWSEGERLRRVADAVAVAAAACPPAEVALGALGMFPPRGAPRVLWVGLDLPPPLHDLQRACERVARAEGFAPEERPFAPHLTLGRWGTHAPRPSLPAADLGSTHIDHLVLYRSELRPDGAVYSPLRAFELGTAVAP